MPKLSTPRLAGSPPFSCDSAHVALSRSVNGRVGLLVWRDSWRLEDAPFQLWLWCAYSETKSSITALLYSSLLQHGGQKQTSLVVSRAGGFSTQKLISHGANGSAPCDTAHRANRPRPRALAERPRTLTEMVYFQGSALTFDLSHMAVKYNPTHFAWLCGSFAGLVPVRAMQAHTQKNLRTILV